MFCPTTRRTTKAWQKKVINNTGDKHLFLSLKARNSALCCVNPEGHDISQYEAFDGYELY
jgi:hypothetical protein